MPPRYCASIINVVKSHASCEKNNAPGECENNNCSKELDKTGKATLVLQVLLIVDKEIAGISEDPEFILKLLRAKFRYRT